MKRRGLRLEVDEPTEWQQRNRRWLASHPGLVAAVTAVLFGSMGAGYATLRDTSWLTPLVGGLLGAGAGGLLGWGFSIENRHHPTRRSKVIYGVVCVVGLGVLLAIKLD